MSRNELCRDDQLFVGHLQYVDLYREKEALTKIFNDQD